MLKRLLLVLAVLVLSPAPALAQAETLEGSWALRIDGATIFRFDLRPLGDGVWRGVWTRPQSFRSNGATFSQATGSHEVMSRAGLVNGGEVELTFDDPRPDAVPDTFRFRLTGAGTALMTYVDTGFAPFPLVRVASGAALGPFAEGRLYDRDNAQTVPQLAAAGGEGEPASPAVPASAPIPLAAGNASAAPRWEPDPAVAAQIAARAAGVSGAGASGAGPSGAGPSGAGAAARPARAAPVRSNPGPAELPALAGGASAPSAQPAAAVSAAGEAPRLRRIPETPARAVAAVPAAAVVRAPVTAAPAPAAPVPVVPVPVVPAPVAAQAAPQTATAQPWQPDPAVSAAIAARAAALSGSAPAAPGQAGAAPSDRALAAPPATGAPRPQVRVGADFLDGL